jgi:hypothetical protein
LQIFIPRKRRPLRERLRRWIEKTLPWRFADRCEMPDCTRHGERGYEAMINLDGKNMLICEECLMRLRPLGASRSRPE